jgi:hypothetical protein
VQASQRKIKASKQTGSSTEADPFPNLREHCNTVLQRITTNLKSPYNTIALAQAHAVIITKRWAPCTTRNGTISRAGSMHQLKSRVRHR